MKITVSCSPNTVLSPEQKIGKDLAVQKEIVKPTKYFSALETGIKNKLNNTKYNSKTP